MLKNKPKSVGTHGLEPIAIDCPEGGWDESRIAEHVNMSRVISLESLPVTSNYLVKWIKLLKSVFIFIFSIRYLCHAEYVCYCSLHCTIYLMPHASCSPESRVNIPVSNNDWNGSNFADSRGEVECVQFDLIQSLCSFGRSHESKLQEKTSQARGNNPLVSIVE